MIVASVLRGLCTGLQRTGNLPDDTQQFLLLNGCPGTVSHSVAVANEAHRVALVAGVEPEQAETAGWLHDISAIFPVAERLTVAREFKLDVLPEEEIFPLILHQKLSVTIAREVFKVQDEEVLSAVGCHTTLRANATLLDKVVFVADKIAWDQQGTPPYLDDLLPALEISVDHAALVYLKYLWDQRNQLRVIHPWMREAYMQLSEQLTPR